LRIGGNGRMKKINHALVIGGPPRIGKDTIFVPVRYAVGVSNFKNMSPKHLFAEFNPHVRSVILRLNEARDLGDINRVQFHEHTKELIASPPETLCVNEKHLREFYILNLLGFIITTNHKDALYLPPDDGRHYVAWSDLVREDFPDGYFEKLWHWFVSESGIGHVVAYLDTLDISKFDAASPPLKTAAFYHMADASQPLETGELAGVLQHLGNPPVVTLAWLVGAARDNMGAWDFSEWLGHRKNRKLVGRHLSSCGYEVVKNPNAPKTGRWNICGSEQMVYGLKTLTLQKQMAEVGNLPHVLREYEIRAQAEATDREQEAAEEAAETAREAEARRASTRASGGQRYAGEG
jgi:hypothetical protein